MKLNVPKKLLYTKEHEWVNNKDDEVIIGITDFAQSQLGDIIFLELPDVGEKITEGEPFGEVEAVKTVSELYAPVNGTVIEVNDDLEDSPDKVNQDCYGEGWIIKIKLDQKIIKENLLDYQGYTKLIE
jgi:glycine cleavage system H protein